MAALYTAAVAPTRPWLVVRVFKCLWMRPTGNCRGSNADGVSTGHQQSPPTHSLQNPTAPRPAPGRILPAESQEQHFPFPFIPHYCFDKTRGKKQGGGTPPLGSRRFVTSTMFYSPGARGSRPLPAAQLSGSGTPPWPWPCRCPCQLYLQPAGTEPSLVLPPRRSHLSSHPPHDNFWCLLPGLLPSEQPQARFRYQASGIFTFPVPTISIIFQKAANGGKPAESGRCRAAAGRNLGVGLAPAGTQQHPF